MIGSLGAGPGWKEHLLQAQHAREAGNWLAAERLLVAVVDGDAGTMPAASRAYAGWLLAETLRELARYDEALERCAAAERDLTRCAEGEGRVLLYRQWILVARGRTYAEKGVYGAAEATLTQVMEMARPDTEVSGALALRTLADVKSNQGRYVEAEECYARALAALERLLPEGDRERCRAVNGLGLAAFHRGQMERAERLVRQAMDMRRVALPQGHSDIGESLHNLATIALTAGRLEEAEELECGALELWQAALGPRHTRLAVCLGNLGSICRRRGQYARAERLYRQVLDLRLAGLGPRHPSLIVAMTNLGAVLHRLGRLDEAEELLRSGLELARSVHGETHPAVARILNNLYAVLEAHGRHQEAVQLLQRSLALWEGMGESRDMVTGLANLAAMEIVHGDSEAAEDALLRALAMVERLLGPRHPDLATPLNNLANLWIKQGKLDQAEQLFLRALQVRADAGYAPVPYTLTNLAAIARLRGRRDAERNWLQRAIDTLEATVGPEAPALVHRFSELGRALHALGDHRSAAEAFRRSLALDDRLRLHPPGDRVAVIMAMGADLAAAGDVNAAEEVYRRAVMWLEELGESYPVLLGNMLVLHGLMLVQMGPTAEARRALMRGQMLLARHGAR